jgi:hypothetical protein
MEIWKDINGFEDLYQISNKGNVKTLERKVPGKLGSIRTIFEKLMIPTDNGKGYLQVGLTKDSKRYYFKVHRLVAEHFIPNPYNKPEVNHKDGIKIHNYEDNLEWATTLENCIHREVNGLGSIEEATKAKMKRVAQIDLSTGLTIKEYDSAKQAALAFNGGHDSVSAVARGSRSSFKGFGWKYIEEIQ